MKFNQLLANPRIHLLFLMSLLLAVFSFWQPQQMDDGGNYQAFAEKIVNQGKIDFSIPGFHGGDFITVIVYLITHSHFSVYLVDILAALLIIPFIYLVVKQIYQQEFLAIIAAYLSVLMPFQFFNALRGGHVTLHLFFVLLALYLLFKNKKYSWIILGISYTIYPFSIVLIPFYIYKKQIKQLFLSFIIPAFYLAAQFLQIGRIVMGQHANLSPFELFNSERFILNIVYGIQNYFSVHNFSPFNPLYSMDMVHVSPLITLLAVMGIFYSSRYFSDKKIFYTLCAFAALAYLLPASFYRMDTLYFWMFNFALILLALPVIREYQRLIPIIVFTSSYQFFYFYLGYQQLFSRPDIIFFIPYVLLLVSFYYIYNLEFKKINI